MSRARSTSGGCTRRSNTWFIARRNTLTDEILKTMTVDGLFRGARSAAGHDDTEPAAANSTGGEA